MSILIKGMNMPTRCEDCPVCHYMERGTITICGCKATMMIRPIDCNSKPYWCPLVEVSAPHGRLIDASAAYDCIAEEDHAGNYVDMDAVGNGLDETPTIIEAEECE